MAHRTLIPAGVLVALLYLPLTRFPDESRIHDCASTASIVLNAFAQTDSTPVAPIVAVLYDENGVTKDSVVSIGNQATFVNLPTGVGRSAAPAIPSAYTLDQSYPNPFNPSTKIRFSLPHSENIDFMIYDLLGRRIASYNGHLNAGVHELEWKPDAAGGVYFYVIKAGDFKQAKKMILSDGVHGSNSLEIRMSSGNADYPNSAAYSQGTANQSHFLAKTAAAKYSVKIMNLPSTSPQVVDTLIQIMNLDRDTTVNVYLKRVPPVVQKENITASVFTSDDSSQVLKYVGNLLRKSDSSVVATSPSGNTNTVKFSNVDKGIEYLVQVVGSDSTRPMITTQDFAVADTIVKLYAQRFLKPAALNPVPNFSMKEDMLPADSLFALLSGTGYDKNGNIVPDSMNVYQVVSQSNTGLVTAVAVGNKIKLASLTPDGNGYSDITARIVAPNGQHADQTFRANVTPMRDLRGILTDDEGNAKVGYVMLYNAAGDTLITKTDSLGRYSLQTNPTAGDTLKGQIINPSHSEGFIRTLYLPGGSDVNNQVVDAVPLLADSAYIGADTLASFVREAAGPNNLQKADLDSVVNYIASKFDFGNGRIDSFTVAEQNYIKQIILQRIDNHFKKASTIIILPPDSVINKIFDKGTTWIRDGTLGFPGVIGSSVINGKVVNSGIALKYVVGNEAAIVQEGLSSYIAPNEVGFTSAIKPSQTVLQKNTTQQFMQPADDLLAKLAEKYDFNTPFNNLVVVGNLEPTCNRLKK